MRVKELIALLLDFDQEAEVRVPSLAEDLFDYDRYEPIRTVRSRSRPRAARVAVKARRDDEEYIGYVVLLQKWA